MKRFLSLFLSVVTLCSYCLNAGALSLDFSYNEKIADRQDMQERYSADLLREIEDDFNISDDGLIIVSKNVENPDYELYNYILSKAKDKVAQKLKVHDKYSIPLVILNRKDRAYITDHFLLKDNDNCTYLSRDNCLVVWDDLLSSECNDHCFDDIVYFLTSATISNELSGYVPLWLNYTFYLAFSSWLDSGNNALVVNEIISKIRDQAYENPVDFFTDYYQTEILNYTLCYVKAFCEQTGYSFEETINKIFIEKDI